MKYKECLISNNLEDVAERYDCDVMNETYDQYKFRAQCWDEQGIFLEDDIECSETKDLIQKRLDCYIGEDELAQSNPNSLGYCETAVLLSASSGRPSFQNLYDCFTKYTFVLFLP